MGREMKIIGIEGLFNHSHPLTHGAAVIQDGDWAINSITGSRISIKDIKRLLDEGYLTLLDEPWLSDFKLHQGMYLMVVNHVEFPEVLELAKALSFYI